MDPEIIKRTVVDRIKKAYIAECRGAGVDAQADITINLYADDLPNELGVDFNALGSILLAIERDDLYKGHIRLETIDDDTERGVILLDKESRQRQPYYRVHVGRSMFPEGTLSDKKPKIFLVKGWWTLSLPGKKELPMFKQGTLAGELLAVLGEAWGATRAKEVVLDMLEKRVTNKATEGRPDGIQIKDAMKEINMRLSENDYRRIKLFERSNAWGATWKFMLYTPSTPVDLSIGQKPTVPKK